MVFLRALVQAVQTFINLLGDVVRPQNLLGERQVLDVVDFKSFIDNQPADISQHYNAYIAQRTAPIACCSPRHRCCSRRSAEEYDSPQQVELRAVPSWPSGPPRCRNISRGQT